jgi:hypothetical protein
MTRNCFRCLYQESFRCRNNPADKPCPDGMSYIEYTGSTVRQCLEATTEIYQDGYIHCPIIDSIGCVECEKRFGDGSNWEYEKDQNYERKPRWLEEVKEVAKKQYWTKCGGVFFKNSTAEVTGFELTENDKGQIVIDRCAHCPWPVEVKEGWPEQVHKRWECRAGSAEPNHKTEWRGSLEDKNTIQIYSLDHQLMEEIIAFCKDHPELGASYNADSQADCRRTVSVNCSSNKKGIAAKKALIEKFFPAADNSQVDIQVIHTCKDCIKALDNDGLPGYLYCKFKSTRVHQDHEACAQFAQPVDNKCGQYECPFNDYDGGCCFADEDPESDGYQSDVVSAVKEHGCNNEDILLAYKIITDPDSCDLKEVDSSGSEELPDENACPHGKLSCDCRCIQWGGQCDVIRRKDWDRYYFVKEFAEYNIDCDVFRKLAAEIIAEKEKKPAPLTTSLEPAEETPVSAAFDYSTVDADTASFLQEKANRITEIRIKSVVAIGKEFKEAQDRLANNKTGTFQSWVKSLGIDPKTAYNYINGFNYIMENFHNIEDAEKIQPSLLFAASKPSAPKELSDKVAAGDITSHKQYKELEKKLKDVEDRLERTDSLKSEAVDKAIKAEQDKRKAEKMRDDSIDAFKKDLDNLRQQLEQAKRNGDPKKVQELGEKIRGYQEDIEDYQKQIGNLNVQLAEKNKQLKDRPIEVEATRTVEVIPDEIKDAICKKVAAAYVGLNSLGLAEIQIFAAGVDPDHQSDVIDEIQNAISILSVIEREIHNTNYAAAVEEAAATSEPAGNCGDCIHSNIDKATPEQIDADQTFCENTDQVVDLDHSCSNYRACWGGNAK